MESSQDPRDTRDMAAVLLFLRTMRLWSQADLAAAAGISATSLCHYELAKKTPSPRTLERIAAAFHLPVLVFELLLAVARAVRWLMAEPAALPGEDLRHEIAQAAAEAGAAVEGFAASALTLVLCELTAESRGAASSQAWPPAPEDRAEAPHLWARLEEHGAEDRMAMVELGADYRSWALCELLCAKSVEAAAGGPEEALHLARLALKVAERVPGDDAWRSLLQGRSWAHVGNALRVGSDLPGAGEAFLIARRLCQAGADPAGLLDPSRVLDLEASFRRAQRLLPEALQLLDEALEVCPSSREVARILIKKGKTLEELGEYERAIETLEEAAPLIDGEQEPQLLFAQRFNVLVNLCFLGRHAEAEPMLPEVRLLAERPGNDLGLVRLRWLEGRVAAGLGRIEGALAAFWQVREEFIDRRIGYDAALVTLELAVLLTDLGRTREVKRLALETAPIFKAQGVRREALATLKLFCQAAQRETLTAALARQFLADLRKA